MLLSVLFSFASAISYSIRYALIKSLKTRNYSPIYINFAYRLFGLPFLILPLIVLGVGSVDLSPKLIGLFIITLFVTFIFNIYQVVSIQKIDFSILEGLGFLEILFGTVLGLLISRDTFNLYQTAGVLLMIVALATFTLTSRNIGNVKNAYLRVLVYYLVLSVIYVLNKSVILLTNPFIFTFLITLFLCLLNGLYLYFFEKGRTRQLLGFSPKLMLVGFFASLAFLGINFGLAYLPIGVVLTIVSSRSLLSLWLSKRYFRESPKRLAYLSVGVGLFGVFLVSYYSL